MINSLASKILFVCLIFCIFIVIEILITPIHLGTYYVSNVKYISKKIFGLNEKIFELYRLKGGDVVDNIESLNANLSKLRLEIIREYSFKNSTNITTGNDFMILVHEGDKDFHEKIKNFSCARSLVFHVNNPKSNKTWFSGDDETRSKYEKFIDRCADNSQSLSRKAHQCPSKFLLINKYYKFSGNEDLCKWIRSGEINWNMGYYSNFTCYTNKTLSSTPQNIFAKIDPHVPNWNLSLKYIPDYLEYMFQIPDVFRAMSIYTNAIVNDNNQVFCDELYVKPNDCYHFADVRPTISDQLKVPQYSEVFVISQYWGEAFFHKMIEDLPRFALFIKFLQTNPQIRILTKSVDPKLVQILHILGLTETRLVHGWAKANIIYMPRSTPCGIPNFFELQNLHRLYRKYILENLVRSTYQPRDKIVLIKRSFSRYFTHHDEIEKLISFTAKEYGFQFIVYKDDPVPSLNETMMIFGSASIVVAPHGAGLSNILFSQPGLLVIEGVCYLPTVNLCNQRTSYILGMQWHGIPGQGCEGQIMVEATVVDETLRGYLKVIPLDKLLIK